MKKKHIAATYENEEENIENNQDGHVCKKSENNGTDADNNEVNSQNELKGIKNDVRNRCNYMMDNCKRDVDSMLQNKIKDTAQIIERNYLVIIENKACQDTCNQCITKINENEKIMK